MISEDVSKLIKNFSRMGRKRRLGFKANNTGKKKKWYNGAQKYDNEKKDCNSKKWESSMNKYNDGLNKKHFREEEDDISTMTNNEFFLAGACLNDLYITKIVDQRIKASLNTHMEQENFVCDRKEWINFIRSNFTGSKWHVVEFGNSAGMIIDWEKLVFIDYTSNSNSVEVKIYGEQNDIDDLYGIINNKFVVATCYVEWVYAGDGSSVNIPLLGERLPVTEMYPFLNGESLEDYYDRFMHSSASILLLIGPPGTGKTTFIRGLLHYSRKNAIVTYDENLLEKDYVFSRLIEDDVSVMVIEDADNFLKSRSDGNSMMHRFLNVGDGLITVKGKKLVFSTNLPSIKDVDAALVRPGRCFDILNFQNYTHEQAESLAKTVGIDLKEKKNEYSLAEIFHQQTYLAPNKKVGFV